MADVIGSLSSALSIVSRLKTISDHMRDAEFKNLLADLNIELAEAKMRLVDLVEENGRLRPRIRELEKVEGEPCPRCREPTWQLEHSEPDATFGDLGGTRRTYRCSACGFSESALKRS